MHPGAYILVIEDDGAVLHTVREALHRAGFAVLAANSAWEAVKRIKDRDVELVVSAMDIGDADGTSLRHRFLLNPETRDIPFLFLMPPGEKDRLVQTLRGGVDDCIVKPIDPIMLVARVEALTQRRRAQLEAVRVDPLTQLLNRPTLDREVDGEIERVTRYKRHASVALADIDGLGAVNRDKGVAMGDLLLTCLAGVVLTNMRRVDLAGRYRGGRVLLFLPETPIDGAVVLMRRVQEQVATIAKSIIHDQLGLSTAVLGLPEHGDDAATVLRRLEETLRYAKATARGDVVAWSPEVETAMAPAGD